MKIIDWLASRFGPAQRTIFGIWCGVALIIPVPKGLPPVLASLAGAGAVMSVIVWGYILGLYTAGRGHG